VPNVLHAVLREVEPGVFQAEYRGELNGPDEPEGGQLPDRHVDTNPDGVRLWVEQMAAQLGYDRVEWDR
jgi:hypothetical protein